MMCMPMEKYLAREGKKAIDLNRMHSKLRNLIHFALCLFIASIYEIKYLFMVTFYKYPMWDKWNLIVVFILIHKHYYNVQIQINKLTNHKVFHVISI